MSQKNGKWFIYTIIDEKLFIQDLLCAGANLFKWSKFYNSYVFICFLMWKKMISVNITRHSINLLLINRRI